MGKIADVQEVTLEKLVPYGRNAKIHGTGQIEKIKASIEEFGFLTPCLIDRDFNIIAGHGRVMAAKELGMTSVPCVFIEGLTEAQRRAYILVDNKIGELADWDMNLLDLELQDLQEIDMSDFGFDITSIDEFGTDFSLPDGEKPEIETMTFTLHREQKQTIENALKEVTPIETFGNTNNAGNCLYEVVRQWAEQRI